MIVQTVTCERSGVYSGEAAVLAEAFVGWLVQEFSGASATLLGRSVVGRAEERALTRALEEAIAEVAMYAAAGDQGFLIAALRERFTHPPTGAAPVAGETLTEALQRVFRAQLAPLADPEATATGRSFLDEIGINGANLATDLASAFVREVMKRAASGDLASLGARLATDEVLLEVRAIGNTLRPAPVAVYDSLPRDNPHFTDREAQLARIVAAGAGSAASLLAIDGMAGVGKTTLAVHAAHRLASRYLDGRLFLDLHGASGRETAVAPQAALEALLRGLGLSPAQIPWSLDERAALWRSLLIDRSMVIVLDNAADTGQVRPLLPASGRCVVIVTSRRRLVGLDGAELLSLNVLPPSEAARLFTRVAGRRRDDETDDIENVTAACGCLPLAVRVLAGRLRHRPSWRVRDLLVDLTTGTDRLEAIQDDDIDVVAAFEASYRGLPADQKRMFRRLGLHPGGDLSPHAAAALSGTGISTAERLLMRLHDQHMIDEPRRARFALHDLLRAYAYRTAIEEEGVAERETAIGRLLDFYTTTTAVVDSLINLLGHNRPERARWPTPDRPMLDSHQDAVRWADTERPNLQACLQLAFDLGRNQQAISLARAMGYYMRLSGYWSDALEMSQRVAAVCAEVGDRGGYANMAFLHGDLCRLTRRQAEARGHYETAMSVYRELDDRYGEARTLHSIGDIERTNGRHRRALDFYVSALAVYRSQHHDLAIARALHSIGDTHRLAGDLPSAREHYQAVLTRYRDLNDRVGEARVILGLGDIDRLTGRYDHTERKGGRALEMFRELGDRLGEADALQCLGESNLEQGNATDAQRYLEAALVVYRQLGDHRGERQSVASLDRLRSTNPPRAPHAVERRAGQGGRVRRSGPDVDGG